MELDYNIFALFQAVGFVQAVTLGGLLVFLNNNEYRSTLFLGVALVLYGLEAIPIILESINAFQLYPQLYYLPFDFITLHFGLIYISAPNLYFFGPENKILAALPRYIGFHIPSLGVFSALSNQIGPSRKHRLRNLRLS